MKRLLIAAISLIATLPLLAASKARTIQKPSTAAQVRQLPSEPGRLGRLVAQYKAATGTNIRDGIGTNAAADMRSVRFLVFPAAGNARGANGEFFRSDVTLISFRPGDHQHVAAFWLQNGVETDNPPVVELTLDPDTYYTFTDFVGTVLQRQNQLGSILVLPIDDAGDLDFSGAIDGFSRIWTNQPNATGTVAQPFEAVDPFSFYIFETASVMGLRHDSQSRSNYGIVNTDDIPLNFTVRFMGERAQNTLTIRVPAGGMIHQAIPAGDYGPLVIEITVDNPEAFWVAYGTSNDNITGDGWVSVGSGILRPADLDDIGL